MQEPTRNDIRKRVGERTGSGSGELAELIFDELRSLAASYLRQERQGHTLQPTALVNEAYLRLLDSSTELPASREGFLRLAAHIMRHVLVDYARARLAEKRGSGKRTHLTLDRALAPSGFEIVDLLSLDEAMTRLAAEKPRMATRRSACFTVIPASRSFGGGSWWRLASRLCFDGNPQFFPGSFSWGSARL